MTAMSITTLIEPPAIDPKVVSDQEKKEFVISDSVSINSSTTLGLSTCSFTPTKSLHVNTRGIALLRLPFPPSELETTIHTSDGSLAYRSTRAKRHSGDCVLTDADGNSLISTAYYFGPSKDPSLRRLDLAEDAAQSIKTVSKWTSRGHSFLLPDGRTLTWKYKREQGFGAHGAKGTALVLTLGDKRIAALIRNDETRTPGSKSCSAGHGGELALGEGVNGKDGPGEGLVVATCLLMLKKEVDRRRMVQFMIITGAIS
ncbi:hypothetical protein FB567DRAFT_621055 [Paraphoma chrysanthemicola]|uniref:Uncharacterized protein n=1 Tax=Paraphoma chrysanthemicola TaxID=798071 RepID=A0A8K0RAQ7_9PLEO|nr:hypothetical protein FB567DRAFT_621055 [Paraphoma chrysanthemicola]